jgi:3-deoxy-D-arabino-heptulosonate 7-phosphate (DAHP) synthase
VRSARMTHPRGRGRIAAASAQGLKVARELLLAINAMGVPAGTEYLDTITPNFIADTIAWGAIGMPHPPPPPPPPPP